jgi:CubicO group peptidase (beta-lactamase class C family)
MFAAGAKLSDSVTQQQALAEVRRQKKLDFEPGKGWWPSASNYLLLGEVAAEASGQSLPDVLRERVFAPLSLQLTMDEGAESVRGYQRGPGGSFVEVDDNWQTVGDAGIHATPTELVRWADNFRTGKLGGEELVRQQTEPRGPVGDDLYYYGAGMLISAEGALYQDHFWDTFGYLEVSPDRRMQFALACKPATIPASTAPARS